MFNFKGNWKPFSRVTVAFSIATPWKLINGNILQNGVERSEGGALILYHSRLIALSTRRKLILYYFTTQQEKERISPCLPIALPMTKLSLFSQWKSHYAFQWPFSAQFTPTNILTASLNSPFFSVKERFLYFCSLDLPVVCNRFMHLTLWFFAVPE